MNSLDTDGSPVTNVAKYHIHSDPNHPNPIERWDTYPDEGHPRAEIEDHLRNYFQTHPFAKMEKADASASAGPPGPKDVKPETAPENTPAAGGGFTGISGPAGGAAPTGPMEEASRSHSQGEAMQSLADDAPSPEMTSAGDDFESELHDHAQNQDEEDSRAEDAEKGRDDARQKVVEILKQIRAAAPQLEQLKQAAPDLYQVLVGMTQALTLTARGLLKPEDQKPDSGTIHQPSDDKKDEGSTKEVGDATKDSGDSPEETKKAEPVDKAASLGGTKRDPKDFDSKQVQAGTEEESQEHGPDKKVAEELVLDHLAQDPDYYKKDAAELEKGKLPVPKPKSGHHPLNLPVGSVKDGKVKVHHQEDGGAGKDGWVSVRAGQVLSNDQHPISSRNPGGK